jgi:hypothetical protein
MAEKPEPPKPTRWTVYELAAKAERLGTVEAPDEAAATKKGAAEFNVACQLVDGGQAMTSCRSEADLDLCQSTGRRSDLG